MNPIESSEARHNQNLAILADHLPDLFSPGASNFIYDIAHAANTSDIKPFGKGGREASFYFKRGSEYEGMDIKYTPIGFAEARVHLATTYRNRRVSSLRDNGSITFMWNTWAVQGGNNSPASLQVVIDSELDELSGRVQGVAFYPQSDSYELWKDGGQRFKYGRLSQIDNEKVREFYESSQGKYIDGLYVVGDTITIHAPTAPQNILELANVPPSIYRVPLALGRITA